MNLTFDTIISYIDSNYDPADFATFNDFIDTIVSDFEASNNQGIILRSDIQEGLFDIYQSEFGLQEPETFKELIKEFSEPEFEPMAKPEAIEPEITKMIKEARSLLSEIKSLFKRLFR